MSWRRRILLALSALLLALAAALVWLLGTTSGLNFVLARVDGATGGAVSVQRAQGRLAGTLTLDGVRYHDAGGLDVRVGRVEAKASLFALLRSRVHVMTLAVSKVDVALPKSAGDKTDAQSSPDLRAPIDLYLDRVQVDGIRVHRGRNDLFVADRVDMGGAWTTHGVELRKLRLRAPDGRVDLDARMAFDTGHRGNAVAQFEWTLDGKPWAGTLQARSNGRTATAHLVLARPSTAQVDITLATRAPHAWKATLSLPRNTASPWLGTTSIGEMAATLQAHGDTHQLHASGTLDLNASHVQLAALDARLASGGKQLQLQRLQLRSPQHPGQLDASGRIDLSPAVPTAQLQVRWQDVTIPATLAGRTLATHGTLDLDGSLQRYRAALDAAAGPPKHLSKITASAQGTPGRIQLQQLLVQQDKGRLDATGTLQYGAQTDWQLAATARRFDPAALLPGWHGSVDAKLDTQGQLHDDTLQATLDLDTLTGTLRDHPLHGHGKLALSPGKVLSGRLQLRYGKDHLTLNGKDGARNDITLDASIDTLGAWLTDAHGALQAQLHLRGTWPQLAAKGTLTGHDLAWHDDRARQLTSRFDIDNIRQPGGSLKLRADDLHAAGFAFTRLDLDASGDRQRHALDVDARGDPLSAHLTLDGGMHGTAWNGRLQRLDLSLADQPAWHLRAPAALAWDRGQGSLGQACVQAGQPQVCVSGERQRSGALHATYRMRQLPLELILALTGNDLPMRARGTLDGDGDVKRSANGALSGQARLTSGQGTVFYLDQPGQPLLRYRSLDTRLDLTPQQQTLRITARLQDKGSLDGDLRMHGAQHALGGRVQVHLDDLRFIELFTPELANLDGTLDADVALGGTMASPLAHGQANVTGFSGEIPALGLKLDQGQLRVSGDNTQSLRIDGKLRSGRGTLAITGSAGLGRGQTTMLALQGKNVQVANIPSATVSLSPDVGIQRDAHGVHIAGVVGVDNADVALEKLPGAGATQASPDVVVVDADKPAAKRAAAMPVTTNLRVQLGDHAHVTGYGLDGDLHGDLLVIGRPGKGALGQGQIRIDGTFRAYGQDLHIERGRLLFASTPLDDPGLDIRAIRKLNPNATISDGQEVGLQVRGTARSPELTVFSNPAMAQSDALSYLITGKPLSQVRGGEGNMVNSAAQALGSATGDLLAKSVGSRLGISDIGVSSNDALGTAAFTVGKYLSPRLYLSYGVGLFEPGQVITLRYLLSRRWNFEAQQSTNSSRASFNYRYER